MAIVIGLIARAALQQRSFESLCATGADRFSLPPVAVIVPARDEALNIGPCLASISTQDYAATGLGIVVIDDGSSDDTAAIARVAAARDPRVLVRPAGELPTGWVGKPHACWVGALEADERAEWLCFVDADTRLAPEALAAAVARAIRGDIDMLCLAPRQELGSFAERLVIPCGLYVLAFIGRMEDEGSGDPERVVAAGQLMLVRRSVYMAVGGHAAVAGAIAEDLALAQAVVRAGGRVRMMGGERLASVRMYRDWQGLWHGFAKNLVDLFGGSANTVGVAVTGFLLAWTAVLLPLGVALAGTGPALIVALAASAAVLGFHVAGAFFLRIPVWYGLLFPLGYTVGAAIALDSVRRRCGGTTLWKGRAYP
jgi:chlorobactene glucosyltransferase